MKVYIVLIDSKLSGTYICQVYDSLERAEEHAQRLLTVRAEWLATVTDVKVVEQEVLH